MSDLSSHGYKLLHTFGLRQGVCLKVDESQSDFLIKLKVSRVGDEKSRGKQPLKNLDLLMVLSQDCDIGCKNDSEDRFIELAHLKPLSSSSKPDVRNQFCQSARKLQLLIDNKWYEAKVAYIVWAEKELLAKYMGADGVKALDSNLLPEQVSQIASSWRALRYSRVALPDKFDRVFKPQLQELLSKLNDLQQYVRGLYLWLDSFEECDNYDFSLMAVTQDSASDEVVMEITDYVEGCSIDLKENASLSLTLQRDSVFCARVNDLSLKEFIRFVKVNVDHVSISSGSPIEMDY